MKRIFCFICLTVVTSFVNLVNGACTYTVINSRLNTCVAAATTSSTVRWFFPHGTIAEQAEFCESSAQSTLATCIKTVFNGCKLEAKSLKMFSTTGDNLVGAYTALCSDTLNTEAQACMSVVTDTASFVAAETAFTGDVTALPNDASATEICGLATTMKYTAYTTLLSATCTDSTHRAVWSSFYNTILNTYVCDVCSKASSGQLSHVIMMICLVLGMIWNHKIFKEPY